MECPLLTWNGCYYRPCMFDGSLNHPCCVARRADEQLATWKNTVEQNDNLARIIVELRRPRLPYRASIRRHGRPPRLLWGWIVPQPRRGKM